MTNRLTALLLAITVLSGCAAFKPYESVRTGPKAKLNFSSPSLKGFILADTDLDLKIYEADQKCNLSSKGKIELEPDEKEKSVFIPANKYAFLNVKYFQNCFGCGSRSGMQSFAFLPEGGKEYTVLYKDNKRSFYVDLFEGSPEKKISNVSSIDWDKCETLERSKFN